METTEKTYEKLREFLILKHNLNTNSSNFSYDDLNSMNQNYQDLKTEFKNKEISKIQIFDKKEALITNFISLKNSIEKLAKSKPNENLKKDQNFNTGGNELFKRVARELQHIICSRFNGNFGYNDIVTSSTLNNSITYLSMINFINEEVSILTNFEFDSFYSFVQYYVDFENRIIRNFQL